jgi:ABC-type branched-subunit amino acid transport system permease subunit
MSSSESLRFERRQSINARRSSYASVNDSSSVGVFAKSLHLVALGWIASLGYLWFSLRQTFVLDLRTILLAIVPLLFIEAIAWSATRWSEWTPGRLQYEAEWRRAFWWSLLPNLLLLAALMASA